MHPTAESRRPRNLLDGRSGRDWLADRSKAIDRQLRGREGAASGEYDAEEGSNSDDDDGSSVSGDADGSSGSGHLGSKQPSSPRSQGCRGRKGGSSGGGRPCRTVSPPPSRPQPRVLALSGAAAAAAAVLRAAAAIVAWPESAGGCRCPPSTASEPARHAQGSRDGGGGRGRGSAAAEADADAEAEAEAEAEAKAAAVAQRAGRSAEKSPALEPLRRQERLQ